MCSQIAAKHIHTTSHEPITVSADDPSQSFEDPDVLNEQDIFDNQVLMPISEQPHEAIPDQSVFKEMQADHGNIYCETQSMESDHSHSIPKSQS